MLYEDEERFILSVYRRTWDGTEAFIFAIDYYEERVAFNILSNREAASPASRRTWSNTTPSKSKASKEY